MEQRLANELLAAAVYGHPDEVNLLLFWDMQVEDIIKEEWGSEAAIKIMLLGGNFGGVTHLVNRGLKLAHLEDRYLCADI